MRCRKTTYPFLRREFGKMTEIAAVINKSVRYVQKVFSLQSEFTFLERKMIADYLQVTDQEERKRLFTKEVTV